MVQIVIAVLGFLLALIVLANIGLEIRGILKSAEKAGTEGVTDFTYYNTRVADDLVGVLIMSHVAAMFLDLGWLERRLRLMSRKVSALIWFIACVVGFTSPLLLRLSGVLIRPFEYANGAILGIVSLIFFVFLILGRTKFVTLSEYRSVVVRTPQLGQFKV